MTAPIVTQDDLAGLLAIAEFLDAMRQETALETDAPERLRDLTERLSKLVILPADA